jgi:ribonuclease HI
LQDILRINNPEILILTETRLGGSRAADLAKSFPFDGFLCTNTIGFAGVVWILWKTDVVEVEHLCSTEQEIHVSVQVKGSYSLWLLSAIYASPRRSERRILWENLKIIAGLHNMPWVMLGDFNDILSCDEKWGGNRPSNSRMFEFKTCLNACNMIDLGFSGPKFTWSNCHDVSSLIMERLDRALANSDWRILFPEATVSHLTRTHSDHCPFLLTLCPAIPHVLPRPFRFENIWLSHSDFPNIVDQAWAVPSLNLSNTFNIFASMVTVWNKREFGNIFHRKNRILARLNGIQCALASNPSESLSRIERTLREDYFNVLKLEEDFWALKSRVGWVVEGDRNTKFFHTSTLVRRRYNKIVRLRNSVGDWITDSDLIRLHIQQGFVDRFSSTHVQLPNGFCLPDWAPRVSDVEALSLLEPVNEKDVKLSLWSFKPFKAPGPDGLHPGFFQKCWNTVGESVVKEVCHIFSTGIMPEYLNKTLISLIPKCLGPETLNQFRPISLCNTVYKIVTKIIVGRLRPIISNLVSPFQAAFVPGRRGIDNVIIAQELIHSIQRKKGRIGQFILKLDLEKAYDRLEWDFIREVLVFFKFPTTVVNLVLECVSTSSFSILVNGGQMETFKPSRRIRQGDPLSPYLFILCMEYLSLKILEACENDSWKPIKASRSGPVFSHLIFADDLLFCAEASINSCNTVIRVLSDFCHLSGQKVNLSKSKVFFSPNVNPVLRHHLCGILRVSSTPNIGKYLGFPLRPNGRSSRDFDFIVEKVQAKLSSWKAKLLSPAGRVVLIQSVTSSIPAYYMQNVALPVRTCSKLDKLNRDFLWGSSSDRKRMHMVGWEKVCKPKDKGGLGLYSTKSRNIALLAKLNWRVMEDADALWAKTLISKYCPSGILDDRLRSRRSGSSNWKGLKVGHETFRKGLRWVVNNGHGVSFWHDLWVGDRPLRCLVQGPLSPIEDSLRVCDVIEGVSMWDLSKISLSLPLNTCEAIKATSVCPSRPLADRCVWDSSGGEFNIKKAYSIAYNTQSECTKLKPSDWIWKVRTNPRIQFFIWQCYHLSVPVRDTLASRGINIPTFCPRCSGSNETLIHLLRDCPDSIAFWNAFRYPNVGNQFYSASLVDWINANCSISSTHDHNIPWQTLFSFGIWNLWLRRNQFVFNPDVPFTDPIATTISFASEFYYLIGSYSKVKLKSPIPVKWTLPPLGWFKLNTDGSSLGNPGLAGGGGIIRNPLGEWVGGFSRAIGFTTSVQAELRALKDGLLLAIDLEILNLEIEMDSLVAVDLINSSITSNAFLSTVVDDCRSLMERFELRSLKHIFREANGCADLLAKAGCVQHPDFVYFPNAPAHVLEALAFDVSNVTRFRFISS